jgi:hypothetical protein
MKKLIPTSALKISLGIFFIILGLVGILPNVQESVFSLTDAYLYLEAIFGFVEIICGVFIIAGLFTFLSKKIKYRASLIILIFWGARIILSKFIWGFVITSSGIQFLPDFASWLLVLSCELIIASCLWITITSYESK